MTMSADDSWKLESLCAVYERIKKNIYCRGFQMYSCASLDAV